MVDKRKGKASAPVKRKLRRIASPTPSPSPPPSTRPQDSLPSLPSPSPALPSPTRPPSPPSSPTRPPEPATEAAEATEAAASTLLAPLARAPGPAPVTDQSFSSEENLFRLYVAAARLGYDLIDVPGDGDCALHAVVHGLLPFGIQTNVATLRAGLVEAASADDYLVAAAMSAFEAESPGHGPARHGDWLASMAHRGTFLDNTALSALATAIDRPIHVFTPSSARVAVYAPSNSVSNVGAPVHVGLNPELFRRDDQGNEIPTSPGHYFAAVAGGALDVPSRVTEVARRMLSRLLAEHNRRIADYPGSLADAGDADIRTELEENGKRLARSVVIVAGLERGVSPELAGTGKVGVANVSAPGGGHTGHGVAERRVAAAADSAGAAGERGGGSPARVGPRARQVSEEVPSAGTLW
ncbi:hypothetical protein A1Q2_07710 [Trichosporon asahii var. asahii CBS 8904]|uniref:OTU domain-containing protein n=1 Tax=Trichosporon asahii var. asahii (strain CBS 8904) TaxID=1220162 RepID=K1W8D3_TRIAC|nr:hypothetical protein A1Q2_07710 [Trichosporon asahii var. asahii CBS 8904]